MEKLTDIHSVNKWYCSVKVMRFVSVCSSFRLLLFPSPPAGPCPAGAGNQRAYLLLPTSAALF